MSLGRTLGRRAGARKATTLKKLRQQWKKEEQAAKGIDTKKTDLLFDNDMDARREGEKFARENPGSTVRYESRWTCPACEEHYPANLVEAKTHRWEKCKGAPMWGVVAFVVWAVNESGRK